MTELKNNEIIESEITENIQGEIIRETEDYTIVKKDGKYTRKAKFSTYSSMKFTTKEDKIWLANLLDGDVETGNGLKNHVGKIIEMENLIINTYDKIDEETGELINGVLCYIITPERIAYVTSSKSVYYSLIRYMELLGRPNDENWENIKLKVLTEKSANGDLIKVKLVG